MDVSTQLPAFKICFLLFSSVFDTLGNHENFMDHVLEKTWKLPIRPQKFQCWCCIPRAAADSKEGSAHFLAKAVCSVDQKPKSPLPLLEPALLSRSRVIVVRIGLKLFFHFIQDQQVVNQPGTTSCVSLLQEKEGEEACVLKCTHA